MIGLDFLLEAAALFLILLGSLSITFGTQVIDYVAETRRGQLVVSSCGLFYIFFGSYLILRGFFTLAQDMLTGAF